MEILFSFLRWDAINFLCRTNCTFRSKALGVRARYQSDAGERERQVFDESSEWKMLQKVTACDIRTRKGLPHVSLVSQMRCKLEWAKEGKGRVF